MGLADAGHGQIEKRCTGCAEVSFVKCMRCFEVQQQRNNRIYNCPVVERRVYITFLLRIGKRELGDLTSQARQ
jgi:hypothetical protein